MNKDTESRLPISNETKPSLVTTLFKRLRKKLSGKSESTDSTQYGQKLSKNTLNRRQFLQLSGAAITASALTNQPTKEAHAKSTPGDINPNLIETANPEDILDSERELFFNQLLNSLTQPVDELYSVLCEKGNIDKTLNQEWDIIDDVNPFYYCLGLLKTYFYDKNFFKSVVENSLDIDIFLGRTITDQEFSNEDPTLEVKSEVVSQVRNINFTHNSIFKLFDILFLEQKSRCHKLTLGNSLRAAYFWGELELDVTQHPVDRYKAWVHEFIHMGAPMTQIMYQNPDRTKAKIGGVDLKRTLDFYITWLNTFKANPEFTINYFLNHSEDTTKEMIEDLGQAGVLKALVEWIAILTEKSLTSESGEYYYNLPEDIQSQILTTLGYVQHGYHTQRPLTLQEFENLRKKIIQFTESIKPETG